MTLQNGKMTYWFYRITMITYRHNKDGTIKYRKDGRPISCISDYGWTLVDCFPVKLFGYVGYKGTQHRVIKIEKSEPGEMDLITITRKDEKLPQLKRFTKLN